MTSNILIIVFSFDRNVLKQISCENTLQVSCDPQQDSGRPNNNPQSKGNALFYSIQMRRVSTLGISLVKPSLRLGRPGQLEANPLSFPTRGLLKTGTLVVVALEREKLQLVQLVTAAVLCLQLTGRQLMGEERGSLLKAVQVQVIVFKDLVIIGVSLC